MLDLTTGEFAHALRSAESDSTGTSLPALASTRWAVSAHQEGGPTLAWTVESA